MAIQAAAIQAIGQGVGQALKLGGAIASGIAQRKAVKRQQRRINDQMKENQDWYNRRYNEDFTQRADAQRLLTMTQDAMRRNNQASAGTAAVMGGTTESVAAAKAANNQVMADTVSQIAADAADQKNAIEQQYMATKANLVDQLNKTDDKRMENAAAMGKSIGEYGDSVADSFSSGKYNALFGKQQPSEG